MTHDCPTRFLAWFQKPSPFPFESMTFKEDLTFEVGYLEDMLEAQDCPICRMMTRLVRQQLGTSTPPLHCKDGSKMPCLITTVDRRKLLPLDPGMMQNLDITFHPGDKEGEGYKFSLRSGRVEQTKADPAVHVYMRTHSTSDGTINIPFLSRWLSDFLLYHDVRCWAQKGLSGLEQPHGLRVVDVTDMKVIDAPYNCKFVALSYVLGDKNISFRATKENRHLLESEAGILRFWHQLPRTIKDAIILLKRIKYRYLWVDSLCISQDDTSQMASRIPAMGRIYGRATFVIIAAFGDDADAGLPGIEADRFPWRSMRLRENIRSDVRLISDATPLTQTLRQTKWYSRGWTMQESRLARAQLTLSAGHAFLNCCCGKVSEEGIALDVFHDATVDYKSTTAAFNLTKNSRAAALSLAELERNRRVDPDASENATSAHQYANL